MCDCKLPNDIAITGRARCFAAEMDISESFADCLGGCSCPCHTAIADEQEKKKEQPAKKLPVVVQFAKMPKSNMWRCKSCGMHFAKPEYQWGRGKR